MKWRFTALRIHRGFLLNWLAVSLRSRAMYETDLDALVAHGLPSFSFLRVEYNKLIHDVIGFKRSNRLDTLPGSLPQNIPGLFQPVRIDRFPWIDINDPATLNNGPAEAAISQGIEDAQQHGLLVDDIDPDRYTEYRNEYFTRYIVKSSMEFFYDAVEYQAGRKPDNRFPSSVS
jgi:hypothetical protein